MIKKNKWETKDGDCGCRRCGIFFKRLTVFFYYLFLAARFFVSLFLCCTWTFSSCDEQGPLFIVASHCGGFSCCGTWALEHSGFTGCGTWAQWSWCMGLVAPWHVKSSRTRDPADLRRKILIHCSAREVRYVLFFNTGWPWKSSLVREALREGTRLWGRRSLGREQHVQRSWGGSVFVMF